MSEKNRAIGIVAVVMGILSLFFIVFGIRLHNQTIDVFIAEAQEEIDTLLVSQHDFGLDPYEERIKNLLLTGTDIVGSFAGRDREQLDAAARPRFAALQRENGAFRIMQFILADGTCFLRLHDPERCGDNLKEKRPMIAAACAAPTLLTGYETDTDGTAYRIVYPVWVDHDCIGFLEFGIDICVIAQALEKKTGSAIAVFLFSDQLREKRHCRTESCAFPGDRMIISNPHLFAEFPPDFDFSQDGRRVGVGDREYIVHSHPQFADFAGRPIGGIIALQDITTAVGQKEAFVVRAVLISSLLLGLALAVLYACFGSLSYKLHQSRRELGGMVQTLSDEIAAREERFASVQRSWEKTFDAISDIVTLQDAEMRILHINRAGCREFGASPEELRGKLCYELFCHGDVPCEGCPIIHAWHNQVPYTAEIRHDQLQKIFLVTATPISDDNGRIERVVHFAKDITAFKDMERQLHQARKMESIGRLAGGVAHDFNNILSAIIGNAELCLLKIADGRDVAEEIKIILKAGKKATRLVKQLLAFSRKQISKPVVLDLNRVVQDTWEMLHRLLGEHIESVFAPAENLWPVLADPTQIEQVIVNLAVNARDAMPSGGRLQVATANIVIEETRVEGSVTMAPGEYVMLTVADTGIGMSEEIREHIFEPFFTTKGESSGTGLGLATVYGIVTQNNGTVFVRSALGSGTTFEIFFPRSAAQNVHAIMVDQDVRPRFPASAGGTETILLVEDDPMVRQMATESLRRLGYQIIEARDGMEAMTVMAGREGQVDLLLTDIILPGMNGIDLAEAIAARWPAIRVLYMSGHIDNSDVKRCAAANRENFLAKPVYPAVLARAVCQVLDEAQHDLLSGDGNAPATRIL
ncbi:MAG: response regulator [Thermodesulfobacteriota bacterium]